MEFRVAKIRGTFLGASAIIRIIMYQGLNWGPAPYFGKLPHESCKTKMGTSGVQDLTTESNKTVHAQPCTFSNP